MAMFVYSRTIRNLCSKTLHLLIIMLLLSHDAPSPHNYPPVITYSVEWVRHDDVRSTSSGLYLKFVTIVYCFIATNHAGLQHARSSTRLIKL